MPKPVKQRLSIDASKLLAARTAAGLSQAQLAAKAGLAGRGAVWRLESGHRQGRDLDSAVRLARALGKSVESLLTPD